MVKLEILKNCVNKTSLQLIKPLFQTPNQVFYKLRLEQNNQFCQIVSDQFIPKDYPILKLSFDYFINIESWEQMLDNQPRSHILEKMEKMIKNFIPIDSDQNFKKTMLLIQLTMQTYDRVFSSKSSEFWKTIYDNYQHPFLNKQQNQKGWVEQYENEEYNIFEQLFKGLAEFHEKNFTVEKDQFFKCLLITRSMMFEPQYEQQFDLVNPFLTLLQHNFEENSYWKKYYDFSLDQDFLMLIAKRDIEKDEKITFNYANKNNINLFVQYGITLPDNPNDKINLKIQLEKFPEILDCYDFKFRILQNQNDKMDIENILIDGKKLSQNHLGTLRVRQKVIIMFIVRFY